MTFSSRQDAGRKLGQRLLELAVEVDLVAGLPRGGVVVAAEVAGILQRPLDVIVVRKIGHPWHREFAVGALAGDGVVILDKDMIGNNPLAQAELEDVIEEEKERLRQYQMKFCHGKKNDFKGRSVLVVDDGLVTGATAEVAVLSARGKEARSVFVAVPVASASAFERLSRQADAVVTLIVDPNFAAVGQYYKQFPQTSDEEVLALLRGQDKSFRPAA